jgi:hypothetical protein
LKLGYNQAEILAGTSRQLICAGQTAVDGQGNPQHPGDMRGQISLAMDNLEAVLAEAGMNLSNVVRLGVYATDVDEGSPELLIGGVHRLRGSGIRVCRRLIGHAPIKHPGGPAMVAEPLG